MYLKSQVISVSQLMMDDHTIRTTDTLGFVRSFVHSLTHLLNKKYLLLTSSRAVL